MMIEGCTCIIKYMPEVKEDRYWKPGVHTIFKVRSSCPIHFAVSSRSARDRLAIMIRELTDGE